MKKFLLYTTLLITTQQLFAQYLPNYYPAFESNRPKGNKSLYYRLYSTSTSTYPATATEFETSFTTSANFKIAGYVGLTSNTGNLNTSASYSANLINFSSQTDLKNAINNQNPYSGFNGDGFTIVVSGYFIPKQTGSYTFTIEGDDAVDLFINNQSVVNHYGPHGNSAIGTHTGTISLVAGKKYLFRVRMQEAGGGEVMQLFWKKPSEASSSVWYQDIEELSGEEVVPNGLVLSVDPGNFYTYPKNGSTYYDLKSNADGAINNATYNTNNGGLIYSDGDMDYVDFGKSPTNFPTGDISVFMWVYASTLRTGWNIMLTKWFSDATGTGGYPDFHYDLYNNAGTVKQHVFTTNSSDMVGNASFTSNTWYQVGFTIGGGDLQMYVNAVPDGVVRTNVTRTNYTQSNLLMGDKRSGGDMCFNGYFGSLHIYNRAITQEEVFQNFNTTKHKYGL